VKPDPKTLAIIFLTLVVIALGVFSLDQNEYTQAKELDLQRINKRLERKDDTIRILIKQMGEQDLAYLKALQSEKIRADRLEEKLQKSNDKLKSIRFIGFGDDTTGRARAIKDLYPSYSHR
jgi:hypothetical protein